jgi:small subunit ribosomal protein S18
VVKRERVRRAKKRVCSFCVEKTDYVDYKDIIHLRKYITERGKILPRRVSGNCARHQRVLTVAIKRARFMALIPFTAE